MSENTDKINGLLEKLEWLSQRQNDFAKEIAALKDEINALRFTQPNISSATFEETKAHQTILEEQEVLFPFAEEIKKSSPVPPLPPTPLPRAKPAIKPKSDLEKFIGENLINKIGIGITVIGVAIGAKYSIEHDLISPLTRIILGYLVGIGLMFFGMKLKKNYESFSAVLVSGAMAIMYFITFAGYSFYSLMPQVLAFLLMVVFTVFTVYAALQYNKQVIAHIALVGAYAVPFLLSNNSGHVEILFIYMSIINIGILVLSFKKNWKPLYYTAFGLTWTIFLSWLLTDRQIHYFVSIGLTFGTIFFLIFYTTFLALKLIKVEKLGRLDIYLLLLNAFIFYGAGYFILSSNEIGEQLLGIFTLVNAVIHFIAGYIINKKRLGEKGLFYLVTGLVLVFITMTIPVQLDGNWVTLLWTGEAVLLFYIGRTKSISIYERLSYPMMAIATFSILQDFGSYYYRYSPDVPELRVKPIFNIQFLTSLLFIAAFSFINSINNKKEFVSTLNSKKIWLRIYSFMIPGILLFVLYNAFKIEISTYWEQLFKDSELIINSSGKEYPDTYLNYDLNRYRDIWVCNFALLFFSILSFVNLRKIKNEVFGYVNIVLNFFALANFLIGGLYTLSELRGTYLHQVLSEYYLRTSFNITIRYISLAFAVLLLYSSYLYFKQDYIKKQFRFAFDIILHISILWILSSELIHWMDVANSTSTYKLGLSILWGLYSLMMIALGIWKKNKIFRISAIVLFGITLGKLFFYDISDLNTISKTIVFVSLGVLLLIISFLYNKYKHIISDENQNQ